MIEDLLSIVVITYNRDKLLQRTLRNLMSSRLKDVNVTVLNNASTDDTLNVCAEFADRSNFKVITHKFNIGGDANIMRAYEYAYTPYLWIMSDDDLYDLDDIDDLEEALRSDKYDVVQVGSTVYESDWSFGGMGAPIKTLVAKGYNYFHLSSNVTCSIVRMTKVKELIIPAYHNIPNHYSHLVYLIDRYENDANLYVTKKRMLSIVLGSENYSNNDFLKWWCDTSTLLHRKSDRKRFIQSQFLNTGAKVLAGCYLSYLKKRVPSAHTIKLLWSGMPWKVKITSILIMPYRFFEIIKDIRKAKASTVN